METALFALAEAAAGVCHEMNWSLDVSLMRRVNKMMFDRLADGKVPPERALDVFIARVSTKLQANADVIEDRYERLVVHLTHEEQAQLTALQEFDAYFNGLNPDASYYTDPEIMRRELAPLFRMCSTGSLSPAETSDAVLDSIKARCDMYLEGTARLTKTLTEQLRDTGIWQVVKDRESSGREDES